MTAATQPDTVAVSIRGLTIETRAAFNHGAKLRGGQAKYLEALVRLHQACLDAPFTDAGKILTDVGLQEVRG